MRFPAAVGIVLAWSAGARAGPSPEPPAAPVFAGSNAAAPDAPRELLVFKGTVLLNEYVYRAVLGVPRDAAAVPETARLVSIGMTPPFIDGQIAAIAATNGLTLVSANLADFSVFEGLQLEDWRS